MTHSASAFIQQYFRIRKTDGQGLNAAFDAGDPAENTNATIDAGTFFRVRFKVRETAGGSDSTGFKLQFSRNSGAWTDVGVWNDGITTTPIEIWPSNQYVDGAATTAELLTSTTGNVNGEGFEDNTSASYSLSTQEMELEWCLMIHSSFSDGGSVGWNANGTTIALRVVISSGTAFAGTYTNPTLTVNLPNYYLGGCFVETAGRVGPWRDGNGNIYIVMESSETDAIMMMMKSSNNGQTWAEVDGANRPTTTDLESVDSQYVSGDKSIHIVHHSGNPTVYHRFRTSDHATSPDTWEITNETIKATAGETDQSAAMAVRSDGTVVAFYRDSDGSNQGIFYKIRSTGGTWGAENDLDNTASTEFTGVKCVRGASDKIHIFYKDTTGENIYHKSLNSSNTLSSRELVEADPKQPGAGQQISMTEPVYWDSSGNEKIMIGVLDDTDNLLYSVVITNDGAPETRKQISDSTVRNDPDGMTSRMPVADMVVDATDNTVYVVYSRISDQNIYLDKATNDGGWGTDVLQTTVIRGCDNIRGNVYVKSTGARVYGFLYADNPANWTGRTYYDEYVIASVVSMTANATAATVTSVTNTLDISRPVVASISATASTNNTATLDISRSAVTAIAASVSTNNTATISISAASFTVTQRISSSQGTTSAGSYTSASFTPTADSRLFVFAATETDAQVNARDWTISNTGSLSFTKYDESPNVSFADQAIYTHNVVVWYADVGGSPSSMTVTVDPGLGNYWSAMVVFDVTGYDTGTPFAQSSVDNGASVNPASDSASGTLTLGASPTSGNLVVAMFGAAADGGGGFATPTGYTLIGSQSTNWVQTGAWYKTDTTTAAVTCSDLGQQVGAWGGIILEMTLGGGSTVNLTANVAGSVTTTTTATIDVSRPSNAAATATVATNNTASLSLLLPNSAVISGTVATNDTATIANTVQLAAAISLATATPDTATLTAARSIAVASPVTILSSDTVALVAARNLTASATGVLATNDTATLASVVSLAASVTAPVTASDTPSLTATRNLLTAVSIATTAADTVVLDLVQSKSAAAAGVFSTNDTVTLSVAGVINISANVVAAITTDVDGALAVVRPATAVVAGVLLSTDAAILSLTISRATSVLAVLATSNDGLLALGQSVSLSASAVVDTTDTATASISRLVTGAIPAAVATNDTATLAVSGIVDLAASATASVVTNDNAGLAVNRPVSVAAGAITATTNLAVLANSRLVAGAITGVVATNDAAALPVVRGMAAAAVGVASSTDLASLALSRAVVAAVAGVISTSDTPTLSTAILLAGNVTGIISTTDSAAVVAAQGKAAVLAGVVTTNDTATLSVAGIVNLAASVTASVTTNDTATLAISGIVNLAASMVGVVSTTDVTTLATARPVVAAVAVMVATPDDAVSLVARAVVIAADGVISTNDTATLAVSSSVGLVANVVAQLATSDIVSVSVSRPIVVTATPAVATLDGPGLAVTRSIAAISSAVMTTVDTVGLLRALGVMAVSTVSTISADASLLRQVGLVSAPTLSASTNAPSMPVVRMLATTCLATSETGAPALGIGYLLSVLISVIVSASDDSTLSVSEATGVVNATIIAMYPRTTASASAPSAKVNVIRPIITATKRK